MSETRIQDQAPADRPYCDHEILLRMDLATEVLEGLDELGLDTRAQVQELLSELERQLDDAS